MAVKRKTRARRTTKATARKRATTTLTLARAKDGERMNPKANWVLVGGTPGRTKKLFKGKLLSIVNKGDVRLAVFSVPK